jgi:integrase
MTTNQPEPSSGAVFHKVAQNLYRLESSGTYYALFKRASKQIRRSLKTTDSALARRRLNELREKVSRLNQTKGASKLTFASLAERWLANHRVHLKEKSISRLDTCLKGLKPYFGHVPIRNISSQQCEAWLTGRGKKISPSSYKHERRVLLAVLNYAVRDGLLLDNPARATVPIRKIPKSKTVIPTRKQFTKLVETIRQADIRAKPAGDLVELLGYSGMRLGEAVNLTWSDIDWDRNTFTVTGGERGTKNLDVRVVPLFPAMRELLERIRGNATPVPTDRIIPIDNAKRAIITACQKAKLSSFMHHSLRHYFCSNAIEAGIDFKVIAGWVGHKDGGFLVAKTYGHLRDAHSFEMAKRMTFSVRDPAVAEPSNVVPFSRTAKSA